MDIDEIKNGLRGVALAEPPLGFDPDDIATRAATSMRNRRAVIGTGLVVACLAAVAVGIASDRGQSRDTAPADRHLAELRAHNDKHLRDVLPSILPNATDISVGQFTEPSPDFPLRATTGTVITFRDDAGPAYFWLNITRPGSAPDLLPIGGDCVRDRAGPNGCRRLTQPDGSYVVISRGELRSTGEPEASVILDGTHHRLDGIRVSVFSPNFVPGTQDGLRSRPALTEEQVVRLVTDPGFNLR